MSVISSSFATPRPGRSTGLKNPDLEKCLWPSLALALALALALDDWKTTLWSWKQGWKPALWNLIENFPPPHKLFHLSNTSAKIFHPVLPLPWPWLAPLWSSKPRWKPRQTPSQSQSLDLECCVCIESPLRSRDDLAMETDPKSKMDSYLSDDRDSAPPWQHLNCCHEYFFGLHTLSGFRPLCEQPSFKTGPILIAYRKYEYWVEIN